MIRLCTGEVYTVNADDYNADDLYAWFSDNHRDAIVAITASDGTYAGMITVSYDPKSNKSELVNCSSCISLNKDMFSNAHTFFQRTGLEYCPVLNEDRQLELFLYNDTHNAWHELERYVSLIGEMKHPAGIFKGYPAVNLYGLNEIGFHLAQLLADDPNFTLCCIGEYWKYLGFSSSEMGMAEGYDVLLEGNYAIPIDEMGYWKHDPPVPDLFRDLIDKMKSALRSAHAYGDHFCAAADGRMLLNEWIRSGRPLCAARLGHTEGWIAMKYLRHLEYHPTDLWWLYHTSGFFSSEGQNKADVDRYAAKTAEALRNTDILFSSFDDSMGAINRLLPEQSSIFPFTGLWHDVPGEDDKAPWISALSGKKVLVVSPFTETVLTQYKKRKLLFSGNQILPEFELIPFQMISTQYGNTCGFRDFFEAYDTILGEISQIDFDIALIGAGAYGFLLASDIKNMGKQSVELCSLLMPLFGIKIKRNLTEPYINKFYNTNWIFPVEAPIENYRGIENGCYWR